jgi:hypothetical protein
LYQDILPRLPDAFVTLAITPAIAAQLSASPYVSNATYQAIRTQLINQLTPVGPAVATAVNNAFPADLMDFLHGADNMGNHVTGIPNTLIQMAYAIHDGADPSASDVLSAVKIMGDMKTALQGMITTGNTVGNFPTGAQYVQAYNNAIASAKAISPACNKSFEENLSPNMMTGLQQMGLTDAYYQAMAAGYTTNNNGPPTATDEAKGTNAYIAAIDSGAYNPQQQTTPAQAAANLAAYNARVAAYNASGGVTASGLGLGGLGNLQAQIAAAENAKVTTLNSPLAKPPSLTPALVIPQIPTTFWGKVKAFLTKEL